MAEKKPEPPKRRKKTPQSKRVPKQMPKSLRGLIRALPDRVKAALIHVLIESAKTGDDRASVLYARYSGEGGVFNFDTADLPCHFTFTFPPVHLSAEEEETELDEIDKAKDITAYRATHAREPDDPEDEQRERYV